MYFFPGTCLRLGPCICFIKKTWLSIYLLISLEKGVHQISKRYLVSMREWPELDCLIKDLPTNKQHPSYWTKCRITRLRNSVRKDKLLQGKWTCRSCKNVFSVLIRCFAAVHAIMAENAGTRPAWCTGLLFCLQTDKLINHTHWEKNRNA